MVSILRKIRNKPKGVLNRPKKVLNPDLFRPRYFDRHKGETFLVLGNGPTLNRYKKDIFAFIDKYSPIVMGANNITGFTCPDYHAFTNRKRFINYADTIDVSKSRVLIGAYIPDWIVRQRYKGSFERLMYVNDPEAAFDIRDGIIQADCRSVSVQLIGVAIVMGAEKVFVAGLDGYKSLILKGPDFHFTNTPIREFNGDKKVQAHYYVERQNETERFLREIVNFMEDNNMKRFQIITPTDYKDHYCAIGNFL